MLDTNLWGIFTCSRHAIPHMVAAGGGSVVNIGSVAATVGFATDAAYCASKGAVHALTRQMALDYAKDGVRVNCVAPGFIETEQVRVYLDSHDDPAEAERETVAAAPDGPDGPARGGRRGRRVPRLRRRLVRHRLLVHRRRRPARLVGGRERSDAWRRSSSATTPRRRRSARRSRLFTESPNFPLYALALDPETCREALELLTEVHADVGVPATLFVCGRTLLHALEPVRAAKASGLFDVQQHTFSHVPVQGHRLLARARPRRHDHGVAARWRCSRSSPSTSRLIDEHVGNEVVGVRTPFGYHRGLRDRPDLLEIVRAAGLRYVTSWGRNEENGNPTPWVQPFAYAEEGYPDILELPFQFWLDVVWFDQHGYDTGPAAARGAEGRGRRGGRARPRLRRVLPRLGRDRLGRAPRRLAARVLRATRSEKGVEVTTYTDYWRRVTEA